MAITMKPGGRVNEYLGLSTDTKPTTRVPNGSSFYEFDTVALYVFDADNQEWLLQQAATVEMPSVFSLKGNKDTVAELPASGNEEGDIWHVVEDGSEYYWDGEKWDPLGSVTDVSATPDWSINDPQTAGYIANRPCYSETSTTRELIYGSDSVAFSSSNLQGVYYTYPNPVISPLVPLHIGDTVVAVVDGEEIRATVIPFDMQGADVCVGGPFPTAPNIIDAGFGFCTMYGDIYYLAIASDEPKTCSFYLYKEAAEETVHKLDPKYYDSADWAAEEGEPGFIENKPYEVTITPEQKETIFDGSATGTDYYNNGYWFGYVSITEPPADMVSVTFDGTVYEIPKRVEVLDGRDIYCYGGHSDLDNTAPTFDNGKFILVYDTGYLIGSIRVVCVNTGTGQEETHQVKIENVVVPAATTVETTEEFEVSVKSVVGTPDWNAVEGEPGYIENKPFHVVTVPPSETVYFDDDITAQPVAPDTYGTFIEINGELGETMTFVFNGVEYELQRSETIDGYVTNYIFGDYGFTEAPFTLIQQDGSNIYLVNATSGNFHFVVKSVENGSTSIEATEEFETAVRSVAGVKRFNGSSVAVSAWGADPENLSASFPYRAAITATGVTSDMFASVAFGIDDAISGNYAPVANCGGGVVYIYAKEIPEAAITVSAVVL